MRIELKGALLCGASVLLAAAAPAQIVIGGGGDGPPPCQQESCGGGDDNIPGQLPPYTERYDGFFHAYPSGGVTTGALRGGLYQYEETSGVDDSYHPIGSSGLDVGDSTSSVHLRTVPLSPGVEPSVEASAHATQGDQTDVDATYWTRYVVHTATQSDADSLAALLAGDPALAHAIGSYTLSASGSGVAEGLVQTGTELPHGYTQTFITRCDPNGTIFQPTTEGCGTHDYSLPLALVRGDKIVGGSALDFYGTVRIAADASVRPDGGVEGTAYAFVDPRIVFSQSAQGVNFTLEGANNAQQEVSFAPEPASWVMMMLGFGAVGAALRSRRRGTARFA